MTERLFFQQVLIGPLWFNHAVTRAIEDITLILMVVMTKNSYFIMLFTFTIFQTIISFYPHSEEVDNTHKILFLLIKI